MKFKYVWQKFLKGFIVSVVVAILTGAVTALTNFVPEGATQLLLWKALGPVLIGAIMALLNYLKHVNDPVPEVKK